MTPDEFERTHSPDGRSLAAHFPWGRSHAAHSESIGTLLIPFSLATSHQFPLVFPATFAPKDTGFRPCNPRPSSARIASPACPTPPTRPAKSSALDVNAPSLPIVTLHLRSVLRCRSPGPSPSARDRPPLRLTPPSRPRRGRRPPSPRSPAPGPPKPTARSPDLTARPRRNAAGSRLMRTTAPDRAADGGGTTTSPQRRRGARCHSS